MPVKHLGHGIHLRRRGEGLELLSIELPLPLKIRSADIPGTALRFEERIFETISQEESPRGLLWQLRPWEEHRTIRQIYELTDIVSWAEDRKQTQSDAWVSRKLFWLMPLVGLLPAATQQRLHKRYNHQPSLATWVSAVPEIFIGFAAVIQLVGGDGILPVPEWMLPPIALLGLEGMARLSIGLTGRGMGSILTLPLALQEGLAPPMGETGPWEPEEIFRDADAGVIELASPITRVDWNVDEVLEHDGESWRSVGWRMGPNGSIYRFERAPGAEPTVAKEPPAKIVRERSGSIMDALGDGVMTFWMFFAPGDEVRPWAEEKGLPPMAISSFGALMALLGGGINMGDEVALIDIVTFFDGLGRLILIGLHQSPVMSIFAWPLVWLEGLGKS